jgi:hypothetical protein
MADDIELRIEPARESDTPTVLRMIRALVDYERLTHEFTVTESILRAARSGSGPLRRSHSGMSVRSPSGSPCTSPRSRRPRETPDSTSKICTWNPRGATGSRPQALRARGEGGVRTRLSTCELVRPQLERVGDAVLPVPGRRPDTGLDQLPHHWSSLRPTRRRGTVRRPISPRLVDDLARVAAPAAGCSDTLPGDQLRASGVARAVLGPRFLGRWWRWRGCRWSISPGN